MVRIFAKRLDALAVAGQKLLDSSCGTVSYAEPDELRRETV